MEAEKTGQNDQHEAVLLHGRDEVRHEQVKVRPAILENPCGDGRIIQVGKRAAVIGANDMKSARMPATVIARLTSETLGLSKISAPFAA